MALNSVAGHYVLGGDVGATKTNLALFRTIENGLEIVKENQYHSKDFNHAAEVIQLFLKDEPQPVSICLGVAGPVTGGKADIINLHWEMDAAQIATQTGIAAVALINDLEATAYGLAALKGEDLSILNRGTVDTTGNIAVIAPGTGLGEAGLLQMDNAYHPFATEGGHTDFAPATDMDVELWRFLQKEFGHVSWERVVSGQGIHNIYRFLHEEKKRTEPGWLIEAFQTTDPAAAISNGAIQKQEPVCIETMGLFTNYLAREAANLVLKLKATAGVFVAGGIPPKIISLLQPDRWMDSFCREGRMDHLLKEVPVTIVLNEKTALWGAAYYGAYNL